MTEAIFGLIGVLVGGAITAGSEYLASRSAERRVRRLSARAIHSELLSANAVVLSALEQRDMAIIRPGRLWADVGTVWKEHNRGLSGISTEAWLNVSQAVVAVASFPWDTAANLVGWEPGYESILKALETNITVGMAALGPLLD
jgi:hypothetical protein